MSAAVKFALGKRPGKISGTLITLAEVWEHCCSPIAGDYYTGGDVIS